MEFRHVRIREKDKNQKEGRKWACCRILRHLFGLSIIPPSAVTALSPSSSPVGSKSTPKLCWSEILTKLKSTLTCSGKWEAPRKWAVCFIAGYTVSALKLQFSNELGLSEKFLWFHNLPGWGTFAIDGSSYTIWLQQTCLLITQL